MERKIIWIGADRGSWRGPGMTRLRHPDAVALRPMNECTDRQDLSHAPREELLNLHYLMRIAGNAVGYEQQGITEIWFGGGNARTDELKRLGWLMYETPWRVLLQSMTLDELRVYLRRHGLPVTGLKADLIERVRKVLTPSEVSEIRSAHSTWVPTALGYTMLHSYYLEWEIREQVLIKAVLDRDVEEIVGAMLHLMEFYPVIDGMCIDVGQIEYLLHVIYKDVPIEEVLVPVFKIIAGFEPFFWYFDFDYGFTPPEEDLA